jgi:hypothetical protein
MKPKEKAEELFKKYFRDSDLLVEDLTWIQAKECALIAVQEIINANPHSNPLNTDVYSTMSYWQEVKQEINNL